MNTDVEEDIRRIVGCRNKDGWQNIQICCILTGI
jgi:hypothetical protein